MLFSVLAVGPERQRFSGGGVPREVKRSEFGDSTDILIDSLVRKKGYKAMNEYAPYL